MKRIFRNIIFLLIFSPLILSIYMTSFFIGKQKSFRYWGPRITRAAKLVVNMFVPDIATARQFDQLSLKMKSRIWFWKPLWDIEIQQETKDRLKLRILNCPFCEVLAFAGLSKLNPSACEGDWAYARENKDKWSFERKHQIGTGDRFCDHTYKRLDS